MRYSIERRDPNDDSATFTPTGEVYDDVISERPIAEYLAECEARDGWQLRAVPEAGGEAITA